MAAFPGRHGPARRRGCDPRRASGTSRRGPVGSCSVGSGGGHGARAQRRNGDLGRRAFLSRGALAAGGAAGAIALSSGGSGALAATGGPTVVVTTRTAAAIQAAINSLPATGGIVQLQPGTYSIGKTVLLRSNCQLVGSGRGVTILRVVNGSHVTAIRNADLVHGNANLAIQALTIDGNKAHQAKSGTLYGIELHRCSGFVLDQLEVAQCDGTGIYVSGDGTVTRVGHISNVLAHDNAVHGIWVSWAMREIAYTAVICDLNGQDGLVIDHSESVATGVHCSRNTRDGIRITNVIANNIVGVLADLNGRYGIHALGFVNSVGAGWAAHNNGLHEPASDVYFDATINTYGITDHAVVHGIECGPAQKSTWGPPYPVIPTPTETYGLEVDRAIQGNLALIGVRSCGGVNGAYGLAPNGSTGSLVILDHEVGTDRLRLLRGSLHVGADLVHDAAGKLGFYGAAPAPQPTVSGDKGGDPAAVIASLLAALADLGLVIDETT